MSPLFTGINPPDFRGTGFVHLLSVKTGKKPHQPPARPPVINPSVLCLAPHAGPGRPTGLVEGLGRAAPPLLPLCSGPEPRSVPLSFRSRRLIARPGPALRPPQPRGLSPGPAAPSCGIWGKGSRWGGPSPSPPIDAGESPARGLGLNPLALSGCAGLGAWRGPDDCNLRPPASREGTWAARGIFPSR